MTSFPEDISKKAETLCGFLEAMPSDGNTHRLPVCRHYWGADASPDREWQASGMQDAMKPAQGTRA